MKDAINYLGEVLNELKKVVWPKKEEVTKLTIIVIAISAIIALYVGVLDFAFTKLLEVMISV